jgi:hypothetical protein
VDPVLIKQPIGGPQDPLARAATAPRPRICAHNIKYSERFTLLVSPATVETSKANTVLTKERQCPSKTHSVTRD